MRRRCLAVAGLALGVLSPADGWAQRVELAGRGEPELDERLAALLARDDALVLTRDTLIARGDTVPGTLVLVDATLRLEGRVAGDLVGIGANLFLRPTARIAGDVLNVAGGLYPSTLATIEGEVDDRPLAPYRVERTDARVVVRGTAEPPSRLALPGAFGFTPPSYDRVDGLGVDWGAAFSLPDAAGWRPRLEGWVGYRSERGAVQGGLALALEKGALELRVGADERTVTNEEWIKGTLENSLAYLGLGKDYRNYHVAERVFAQAAWRHDRAGWTTVQRLRLQRERDESLAADDPWTLFEDDFRPNPPVAEGAIAGFVLESEHEWVGGFAAYEGTVQAEWASAALGDLGFARFLYIGEWEMLALRDHVLELEWTLMGPLPGTRSLPPQRWSFVGGSGTFSTIDPIGRFRGDRVVYFETDYIIPLPPTWRLPVLGVPDLRLLHRVGMAWTAGDERDFEQNLGARLDFFGVYLRVLTNPAEPREQLEFGVGLDWPFGGGHPWEP